MRPSHPRRSSGRRRSLARALVVVGLLACLVTTPVLVGASGPACDRADTTRCAPAAPSSASTAASTSSFPGAYPSPREGARLAVDLPYTEAVLFGGETPSGQILGDTWTVYPGSYGVNWTELSPSAAPTPRYDYALTYDGAMGEDLLFGGNSSTGPLNDSWTFSDGAWTNVTTGVAPPARSGAVLVYDPVDSEAVLFGGEGAQGPLNDTWTYSPTAGWENVSPVHSPSPRSGAAAAYDGECGCVLLFGGRAADGAALGDTWTFASGAWTELFPSGAPPARYEAGMANLSAYGVLLFGGSNGTGDLGDTYTFGNLTGGWTYQGTGPAPRADPALAWFPGNNGGGVDIGEANYSYALLFGGYQGSTPFNDSWGWNPTWFELANPGFGFDIVASSTLLAWGESLTVSVSVLGGSPPFSFAYGGEPPGCGGANGSSFSCVPSAPGGYLVTVAVGDRLGNESVHSIALSVATPTSPPVGSVPSPLGFSDWLLLAPVAGGIALLGLSGRSPRPPRGPSP